MTPSFKISIHQLNPFPGDFNKNLEKALQGVNEAIKAQSCLLVFPARSLTGMPYNSLFKKDHFLKAAQNCLANLFDHINASSLKILITCPLQGDCCSETPFLISRKGVVDLSRNLEQIID